MLDKSGAAEEIGTVMRERPGHVSPWHYPVANRLPETIALQWIHYQPGTAGGGIRVAACLCFTAYQRVLRSVGAVVGIALRSRRLRDGIDFVNGIAGAVDIQIEAEVKIVLMNRRI